MKRIIILTAIFLPLFLAGQQATIIDHNCLDLDQIPDEYIEDAKTNLWIGYGDTSHGTQLTAGMNALKAYFTDGTYDWSQTGGPGELQLYEGGNPATLTMIAVLLDGIIIHAITWTIFPTAM